MEPVGTQTTETERLPAPRAGWGTVTRLFQYRESGVGLVAILLIIVFQILNHSFLSFANIAVVLQLAAEIAVVAIAEVMVMVLGEIDLSIGNVFAFSPFIMYLSYKAGVPLILAIVIGLLSGVAAGWVNAVLHVNLRIPSFVATLATLYAIGGLTLIISNGFPQVTPGSGLLANVMGVSPWSLVVWALVIAAIWHFLLTRSRFGIYTVSVGSNAIGSREVGIPTARIRTLNFILAGMLGGFVGILVAFNVQSVDPLAGGTSILLEGIAAAVIGGTALTGGSGTIVGAVIGAFVISALNDGMNLLGVNAYLFDVVLGIAIAVAMFLNIRVVRARGARA